MDSVCEERENFCLDPCSTFWYICGALAQQEWVARMENHQNSSWY